MEFEKGDIVIFKPEHREENDDLNYVLIEEPDGGRVKVKPIGTGLEFPPIQVVKTDWLVRLVCTY